MKYLYLTLLLSSTSLANRSLELNYSGLTTHIVGANKEVASLYRNKVNDNGFIHNDIIGYTLNYNQNSFSVFVGQNSIGESLRGFKYSRRYRLTNIVEAGYSLGLYHQDGSLFPKVTKTCNNSGLCRGIGTQPDIVPIVGFDLNFFLYRGSVIFIKQVNLITPLVTNHGISVGFSL